MKNCIISGFAGALCMFILIVSLALWQTKPQAVETEKHQHVDFVSVIDKKECFVCGEHKDPLTTQYWDKDNIGILNLNTFQMMYIEINRYDDDGELIQEPAGVLVSDGLKCEDSWLHSMTDPDRGYSHVDISNITGEIDVENLQTRLCQDCLDQLNSDCILDSKPTEYAVISFAEKRIRAVIESIRAYGFDSYRVYTEFEDDSIRLKVDYCPVRYRK